MTPVRGEIRELELVLERAQARQEPRRKPVLHIGDRRRESKSGHVLLLARLAVAGAAFFCGGVVAGMQLARPTEVSLDHATGACAAIEMAAAHGYLDDLARERVIDALAGPLNPLAAQFAMSRKALRERCAVVGNRAGVGR